jgi:hypothetical protein
MSFSVNDLADVAAGGNPQAISGVWRTCRAGSMVERGEPCPQCAGRGGQVVAPHVCRYRRPGALDRLQAEGVALVERRGKPPRLIYRVRVFTLLPLLTPPKEPHAMDTISPNQKIGKKLDDLLSQGLKGESDVTTSIVRLGIERLAQELLEREVTDRLSQPSIELPGTTPPMASK